MTVSRISLWLEVLDFFRHTSFRIRLRAVSLFLENPWVREERKTSKRETVSVTCERRCMRAICLGVARLPTPALLAAARSLSQSRKSRSHACFAFLPQFSEKRETARRLFNNYSVSPRWI